jgi:hypothetical protein
MTGRNPFERHESNDDPLSSCMETEPSMDIDDWHVTEIVQLLAHLLGDEKPGPSKVMTRSMIHGIIPWCGRVLVLIDRLPSSSDQARLVLTNICDLYITTAFRLCSGNSANERILLGLDRFPSVRHGDIEASIHDRFSRQNFSFGHRSQQQPQSHPRKYLQISPQVEAEMCALATGEEMQQQLPRLRDIILNGQSNLKGIAKLDLVDQWIQDPVLEEDTDADDFSFQSAVVLEKRMATSLNVVFIGFFATLVFDFVEPNEYHEIYPWKSHCKGGTYVAWKIYHAAKSEPLINTVLSNHVSYTGR